MDSLYLFAPSGIKTENIICDDDAFLQRALPLRCVAQHGTALGG